jgi:hypothetical protein
MFLMGEKGKKDWPGAKKMMKDIGRFMEALKNFDATTIPDDVINKVKPIINEPFFNEVVFHHVPTGTWFSPSTSECL